MTYIFFLVGLALWVLAAVVFGLALIVCRNKDDYE